MATHSAPSRRKPAWGLWPGSRCAASSAGLAVLLVLLPLTSLLPSYKILRERAFDWTLQLVAQESGPATSVVVADIDQATLARIAPWPWSREQLAALIGSIARHEPKAIGLDILLAGADARSPAALARELVRTTGAATLTRAPDSLPDGDKLLATAISQRASVLGAALTDTQTPLPAAAAPVLVTGAPRMPGIWQAPGALMPFAPLAAEAQGVGALVLAGDADGRVRRVPLLVRVGEVLLPGLAIEMARVGADAGALIIDSKSGTLHAGEHVLPLPADASLRLLPSSTETRRRRTVSAASVLDGSVSGDALRGRMVLIGSTAPQAGGLRLTAAADLIGSVQIQADALQQIVSGLAPRRPAAIGALEVSLAMLAAAAACWLGRSRSPVTALIPIAGFACAWIGCAVLLVRTGVLIDPLLVPASATLSFAGAAIATGAATWAREARLRRRFEQHLAPEVVSRIIAEPAALKLEGEQREVTVLFTDVEGFTALVERGEPRAVVSLLDDYIDRVSEIIVAHGGMIDKVVGDAVHALFNAPLDLPRHQSRAVACAEAVVAATEALRATPAGALLGLGRTRIGIETGPLLVGDVGGRRKLDYTAHGDAINTAARLEQANKELGTSICIGPGTARAVPSLVRPVGHLRPRGRSAVMIVSEPWPATYSAEDKSDYLAVFEASAADEAARQRLAALEARQPGDPALARLASAPGRMEASALT